jgi:hypothetical protein
MIRSFVWYGDGYSDAETKGQTVFEPEGPVFSGRGNELVRERPRIGFDLKAISGKRADALVRLAKR